MTIENPHVAPAELQQHICTCAIPWPKEIVAELQDLDREEKRFEDSVKAIDDNIEGEEKKRTAIEELVRLGTATDDDFKYHNSALSLDELKSRFRRPKNDIEAERESFQRAKVQPVLRKIAAILTPVVDRERAKFCAELEAIYKRAGVPFKAAEQPLLHAVDRWRDMTVANLIGREGFTPNGCAAVKTHLGAAGPKF